jgi:AraC-like DNA-binding protein/quercetin dioxygenase-like cupin family protein
MRYAFRRFVPPGGFYHLARVQYQPGQRCEVHDHDFSELFFIEAGRGIHRINGRTVELNIGDLIWIRPEDRHGFSTPRRQSFTMVNLAFANDTVEQLKQRYFDEAAWPAAGDAMPATWQLDEAALRRVRDWIAELSRPTQRRIDLDLFLLQVLRLVDAPTAPDEAGPQPQWLRDAVAAFTEADDLTGGTSALVDLTGKSPEHVNRTVRKCFDQTTSELVNTIRLDRAAHLLRMTGRPIIHVAHEAGFENLGYFYRRFGERFGTTPRKFRTAAHAVAR